MFGKNDLSAPRLEYDGYYLQRDDLTLRQKKFLDELRTSILSGNPLIINENYGYLFVLAYEAIAAEPLNEVIAFLTSIAEYYDENPSFSNCCRNWIADCHVLLGDVPSALATIPKPKLGSCNSSQADRIISLKFYAKKALEAPEILSLFRLKLTDFGKGHIAEIAQILDQRISDHPELFFELLGEWVHGSNTRVMDYPLFTGVPKSFSFGIDLEANGHKKAGFPEERTKSKNVRLYNFSLNNRVQADVSDLIRKSENDFRLIKGLPSVGESWLSETLLFNQLSETLHDFEVVRHASPVWLGRQHLDIFIPSLGVAIEYQGIQHDQPVEFFGGEPAFKKRQKLDAKKRRLCKRNGVRLIEVREGYALEQLIQEVLK